jgi:hypothetical protein
LERERHFKLPAPVLTVVSHWRTRRHAGPVPAPKDVPEELRQVGNLHLVLVSADEEERMRTWNELMARERPQGKRRLVGRQLRYLVGSAHGWLGAVGFSASALYLEARDRWIGWDAQERRAHEGRVVNLSRLLIRPGVRCRVLAWRIQLMALLGREVPELPCDVFFENWEVKVLEALQEQRPQAKDEHPLRLAKAITLVAQLGGYLARGCDPPPGTKCLWKGMIRLSGMAEGYRLAETRAASP